MACDSEEAAKQSETASDIVPILAGVLAFVSIVLAIAVNLPGPVQRWWTRKEEKIMVGWEGSEDF